MNKVAYYDGVLGVYKRAGLQEEDLQRDVLEAWNSLTPLDKEAIAKQVVADMEADGELAKHAGWGTGTLPAMVGKGLSAAKNFGHTVGNAAGNYWDVAKGVGQHGMQGYMQQQMLGAGKNMLMQALPYIVGIGGGALAGGAMGGWKGALGGAAVGGLGAYGVTRPGAQDWFKKQLAQARGMWDQAGQQPVSGGSH